ncbi:hypothetical protein OsI_00614 [Oryza sativa Indica Group]|uniref:Glycosyltransferase n=1 Tax=Oryza sativa subsp. indica TaxID=39946 RepID=A2WLA1_ORYSI|nr:hypothetical protein OsI_00614 [Oryza sativa Indica Group]
MAAEFHFLVVPLIAQGHIIPMVEVARLLAARGARATVVTTPVNAARNGAAVEAARRDGLAVDLAEVAFPGPEFGVPEGLENMDQLADADPGMYLPLQRAIWAMAPPLERLVRALPRRPDCLVADYCNPWTAPVCDRLGIARVVMHCPSAYFLLATHNLSKHGVYGLAAGDGELEPFVVPDFPVRAVVDTATFRRFFQWPGLEEEERDAVEAERTADGFVINTFRDIEGAFVDGYAAALGRRAWAIGPTCAAAAGGGTDADARASRGNRADVDAGRILSWLDARPPASVLYISFGSISHLAAKQVIELARGIEASGRPFVWAIKEAAAGAVREWLDGEGYEERVKDRGVLVRGWAPQVSILSHPATGGFLTHCGWNSTLEAIAHGVPALTWPTILDQFSSERLLVDVLGVGVRSGVTAPPMYLPAEAEGVQVTAAGVEKAVAELMDGGADGAARRARARELAATARAAVEEGGSSHADLTDMIRHVAEVARTKRQEREVRPT